MISGSIAAAINTFSPVNINPKQLSVAKYKIVKFTSVCLPIYVQPIGFVDLQIFCLDHSGVM